MAKATHKSNVFSWFGYIAKRRIETAPEDKEIIHRVLFEEIINIREWGARNKERVRAHNARKKEEELEWTGRVGTH